MKICNPNFSGSVPRAGQSLLFGLLFGLLCALLVTLSLPFGLLGPLDRAVRDTQFRQRGLVYPSPNLVLIKVDDAAASDYGLPVRRHHYAELIDRLTKAGAKTIVFDVQFSIPSASPASDAALVRATAASGRVIHAAEFRLDLLRDLTVAVNQSNASFIEPRFRVPHPDATLSDRSSDGFLPSVWGLAALPALRQGAAGLGYVNAPPDDDGVMRWIPHLVSFRSGQAPIFYPSLALAASAHFLDVSPAQIEVGHGQITLPARSGTRNIPVDAHGNTWINWIPGNEPFLTRPLKSVLNGQVPDSDFKGKIVLVGVTAGGSAELKPSPFSPAQPAYEVQANAINDILLNRCLKPDSNVLWIGLMCGFSVLVGAATMKLSTKASGLLTLLGCVALWITALVALSRFNFVLHIAASLTAGIATWSLCVAFVQIADARRLRLAEERYALAVRGANDGLWDWNLKNGEIYYSPRWKAMLGYDGNEAEIAPRTDEWLGRIHPEDIGHTKAQLDAHIAGHSAHFESQHRIRHRDGRYLHVLARGLRVCDLSGTPSRMAGSQSDISAQVEASSQLQYNAYYDALTGLANRAFFMQLMARALSSPRRRGDYLFAVLFLDIDRFKIINESLGHGCGDELLLGVARRLEGVLRPGDTAARLGADEFAVLLDDVGDIGTATRVAARIQEELSKVFVIGGQEIYPTLSIGIALSSPTYRDAEALLRDADTAMVRAKGLGRARHAVFDEEMHAAALDLLRLQTDLRHGIERDEFFVVYQPIVALQSGEIAGFEALIRWKHPIRGMISPADFIPLAEETGLVIALDHFVLRSAAAQIRAWQDQFGGRVLTLSANLSSKQFLQHDLIERIQNALEISDLAHICLKLEITEGVLMNDPEAAAALLTELRALGIRLSIDDFGTGYSSLSYLHRFPLDTLKIDQSFVKRMQEDGQGGEIVTTIVQLAGNLKMDVIAEGIETDFQLAGLREMGCDYGQGYFFSRPLTADKASELLASGKNWAVGTQVEAVL